MRWGARLLLGLVIPVFCGAAMVACGSGTSQLSTKLTATSAGSVNPGDSPTYVVTVINKGPDAVTGVTVHVDLPADFRYKATTLISGQGNERVQLRDAAVKSPNPEWGLWSLASPKTNADGTIVNGELDITFSVDAEGAPGTYQMAARASSESTDGPADAKALPIVVAAAPHLSMVISASPGNIHPNDKVAYTVHITNDGTGAATQLTVLVSLPAAFAWIDTTGIAGNSSRDGPVDPLKNTSLVDYGGFTVPARSDAGPGLLVITFRAQCLAGTPSGSYPVSGQITDSSGLVIEVRNTVPVNVVG